MVPRSCGPRGAALRPEVRRRVTAVAWCTVLLFEKVRNLQANWSVCALQPTSPIRPFAARLLLAGARWMTAAFLTRGNRRDRSTRGAAKERPEIVAWYRLPRKAALFGGPRILALPLAVLSLAGCVSLADRLVNRTVTPPPYAPAAEAEQVHQALFVADLHADTLLWSRDLLQRATHGHVDVPRLRDGHVALQVFGVVTQVPLFLGLDNNSDRPDVITALARMQGWPEATYASRLARAMHQRDELAGRIAASGGALRWVRNRQELEALVAARAQARGMLIDLAHASAQAVDEVLAMTTKPVIVSHGGARGTCDSVRNLSDAQLRGIAASGGVIGVGLFKYATCGTRLEDTVRAMRYVADRVGVAHVALGSDWDGSTAVIEASGLALLTEGMLKAAFARDEIAAILGTNVLRVLRHTLPDSGASETRNHRRSSVTSASATQRAPRRWRSTRQRTERAREGQGEHRGMP